MNINFKTLKTFTSKIFASMGCSAKDAELAAEVLVTADLRGIDSHGVARLSGYVRLWEAQRINPKAKPHLVHETISTGTVEAEKGLGLTVAPYAMKLAIEKAQKAGSGWVSVRNSNHFGIAGYHAMMALDHNMIGIAMTNASPLVAPTFSKERLLGTNPIAIAIPSKTQPPFVGDFATTTAANGKLEILQRKNKEAPLGWVQDSKGNFTTNQNAVKEGGALLPLGSDREHGSHKGYILGSVVDIFSAVFSGAGYGPWAPPFVSFLPVPDDTNGKGLGHFFGAFRIDAFRPAEEFLEHMDNWIVRFRNAQTVESQQRVLIPGDPERETEQLRKKTGIDLNDKVWDNLLELSRRFEVQLEADTNPSTND